MPFEIVFVLLCAYSNVLPLPAVSPQSQIFFISLSTFYMSNMFLLSMFLILSAPVAITAYTIPEGVASDAVSSLVKRESLMPASVASYEKSEKMNKDNACIGEPLGGRKPDTFFQPKMPKGGTGDSQCYDASAWTGGMIGINWGGKGGYQFKAVTLFKDDKCKDESNWYLYLCLEKVVAKN